MGQRDYEANLVIERAIIAMYDLGSRPGATRATVVSQLKRDGFTNGEIAEAARRMLGTDAQQAKGE